MSSSKRQKTTSSQAGGDGQQTINAKSVAARLRWEKKRQSDREKQEQVEYEARLKFEQQLEIERQARVEEDKRREQAKSVAPKLRKEKKIQRDREKQEQVEREARLKFEQQFEIERQARAEDDNRREREQREYNERVLKEQLAQERFSARPENQFIAERTKARRVEGQRRRRLKEKEKQREENRKRLLDIRSEGSGQAIRHQEGSAVCGGEVNLGGEPHIKEQLMHQKTQSDGVVLDDREYRQRVLEEKQRQTQLFCQQPCTEYILGQSRARSKKAYNERKKADRASKKESEQKGYHTWQMLLGHLTYAKGQPNRANKGSALDEL